MILLVEDNTSCSAATVTVLRHLGYAVQAVACAEEALQQFDPNVHRLVLTDSSMPGMSGPELAVRLKRLSQATPVVLYTAIVDSPLACVDKLILKPASVESIREALSCLLAPASPRTPPEATLEPPGSALKN
jgi:CheY-like chemotaxis protein